MYVFCSIDGNISNIHKSHKYITNITRIQKSRLGHTQSSWYLLLNRIIFCCCYELRTLIEHTPLHLSKHIAAHIVATYQHSLLTLCLCLSLTLFFPSFFFSSHTIHVKPITFYKTILPPSTIYVPLQMFSFTSLLSYNMLMILT